MIISGACSSKRCFKRLFLLITLLYKSFRSEVANLPPSSCTIGCSSGGKIGKTVKIIHSGLFPLFLKLSITRSLFIAFFLLWPEVCWISSIRILIEESKSNSCKIFKIASAPISALKTSPHLSLYSLYLASVNNCISSIDSKSSILVSASFLNSSIFSEYFSFKISSSLFWSLFLTFTSNASRASFISPDEIMFSNSFCISAVFSSKRWFQALIASSLAFWSIEVTIYWAKYKTLSRFFGETSNNNPNLEGVLFENQMWATGAASLMCPILSLLTFALVTSTPHLSQITPLYLIFLYFPQ